MLPYRAGSLPTRFSALNHKLPSCQSQFVKSEPEFEILASLPPWLWLSVSPFLPSRRLDTRDGNTFNINSCQEEVNLRKSFSIITEIGRDQKVKDVNIYSTTHVYWINYAPDILKICYILWQLSENIPSDLCCGKWAIRMLHYPGSVSRWWCRDEVISPARDLPLPSPGRR